MIASSSSVFTIYREQEVTDQETTGNTSAQDALQQTLQRARELNEQILQSARKTGEQVLDRYVSWLEMVAEQQRKLAATPQVSQMDWMAAMLNAQADFTRQFADFVRGFPPRGQ